MKRVTDEAFEGAYSPNGMGRRTEKSLTSEDVLHGVGHNEVLV